VVLITKEIALGDYVKDDITGFSGVAVAKQTYLHGSAKFLVQPKTLQDAGGTQSAEWFDSGRLSIRARDAEYNRADVEVQ